MNIEHIAINVADPVAQAGWYCAHLGFTVARRQEVAPYTHFLRETATGVMLEIYCNPSDQVPDYRNQDPLLFHLAFATATLAADQARLLAAGASLVSEQTLADGSRLAMLRDPWGVAIQLCQRAPGFFAN
jgi:catechol 2,3-dioxygenase-like lactoylglutathione lyase family enzyme